MSGFPLPRPAAAKLMAIAQASADADALSRVALAAVQAKEGERRRLTDALGSVPPHRRGGVEGSILVIDSELETLRRMHAERSGREAAAKRIFGNIKAYLDAVPENFVVQTEDRPPAKPKDGETQADALARVRAEISDLQYQLHSVAAAPLPPVELKKQARSYVRTLAQRGKPTIKSWAGQCEFEIRSRPDAMTAGMNAADVAAFMAWLDPDTLIERFEALIDAMPAPASEPLSADEVAERKRELPARILKLERDEERIIEALLNAGQDVARRSDADPRAILGVKVVRRVEKAA